MALHSFEYCPLMLIPTPVVATYFTMQNLFVLSQNPFCIATCQPSENSAINLSQSVCIHYMYALHLLSIAS